MLGLFWTVPEEVNKKAPKTPPGRPWEKADYLPNYEEALAWKPKELTQERLDEIQAAGLPLFFDIETWPNYFLASFMSLENEYLCFESPLSEMDCAKLKYILEKFLIVSFNGNKFDLPVCAFACAGKTTAEVKGMVDQIILEESPAWMLLRTAKVKALEVDSIDLLEVCPLTGSLKTYAGRLHANRIQDLPFSPHIQLSDKQKLCVRHYNQASDLPNTKLIFENLEEQIKIRVSMSQKYGLDLRSKSDAQLAEAVINSELKKTGFIEPKVPELPCGYEIEYQVPDFLIFKTEQMREVLRTVANARFQLSEAGYPVTPKEIEDLKICIGKGEYTLGLGGLHSNEASTSHIADEFSVLLDRDVTSYYPSIILNLGLYPKHLGTSFLDIYKTIVERRIAAKKAKNKTEADMLKIVVNGSFGKFGSKYSTLYSPDLLLQVTLTGQLSLLLLIESLELSGIPVVSANTDGIVIHCPNSRREEANLIFKCWEQQTGFDTEETEYKALFSKDVNNYIALKSDGKVKLKGEYSNPWASKGEEIFRFHKNPDFLILTEAVTSFLKDGIPIEKTIHECKDIKKFLTLRTVKGGASLCGNYLGKVVRYYWGEDKLEPIVYCGSGNKVPLSDGAVPCMDIPDTLPKDIAYSRYEEECFEILKQVGYPFWNL